MALHKVNVKVCGGFEKKRNKPHFSCHQPDSFVNM